MFEIVQSQQQQESKITLNEICLLQGIIRNILLLSIFSFKLLKYLILLCLGLRTQILQYDHPKFLKQSSIKNGRLNIQSHIHNIYDVQLSIQVKNQLLAIQRIGQLNIELFLNYKRLHKIIGFVLRLQININHKEMEQSLEVMIWNLGADQRWFMLRRNI
ncbi:unnamed protein product [Paramecium sonneborni]|uniref:Uncharacterized protein n=1 Tax=Paramecium sonneborni TaxID=65129 RepID=A0A8S1RJE3_9CILI|nr:unnamed protein product [Paramecium sonneborni]